MPACNGIRAPETKAIASNDQYTCGDIIDLKYRLKNLFCHKAAGRDCLGLGSGFTAVGNAAKYAALVRVI